MPPTVLTSPTYSVRWNTLYERIGQFETLVQTASNSPTLAADPTRAHALCLLAQAANQLRIFTDSHLNYFNTRGAPAGYTQEYGIALALQQAGFDLEVLEQAAHQRLNSLNVGTSDWNALNQSDRIARSITATLGGLLGGAHTALVYFQKSPRFHGMPYAPIALTAIPYTTTNTPRDLLATAHEIGHYVFWRLNGNKTITSSLNLIAEDSWIGAWTEEIFADVFGYLVGGPLVGLSLQDLLMRHDDTGFVTADLTDTHPTPILRPYIHNVVLQLQGEPGIAATVMGYWNTIVGSRPSVVAGQLHQPLGRTRYIDDLVSTGAISLNKPIDFLVDQIYRYPGMNTLGPVATWAGTLGSYRTVPLNNPVEVQQQLNGGFSARVQGLSVEANLPENCNYDAPPDPWGDWIRREGLNPEGINDWLDIAHARGWVERPPDNWPKTG